MTPRKQNYTDHDLVAKSLGMKGSNGIYITKTGIKIDATAAPANRLVFGYLVAKELGHIK